MRLSRGMIKLSYCQAESSHINSAALCLKYIITIAVSAAAFVMWLRNYGGRGSASLLGCSALSALIAVYFRTSFMQKMYDVSARYLRSEHEISHIKPNPVQMFGFGSALLAVKCSIVVIMLMPAAFCLRTGAVFYSMSGRRAQFLLMINAALCLTVSGVIFAMITLSRLGCAEYLFFSGRCNSVFSALDCSWLVTCGEGSESGEALMIHLLPSLFGARIAALSRLNLSDKLTREYFAKKAPKELYVELIRDNRGEQRLDLLVLD